jgi:type I restriction enzyme S subunit
VGSAGLNGFHNQPKAKGPGVTIGRSGGSIGKVTYVPCDYWPHNTCIYVTDFKGNDPRFVAYLLSTFNLAQLNSGSAQPSLNRNFVYPVRIKIPSKLEQGRIASMLLSYDDLIENNRRRIALLEQAARLLYKEWFVHLRFPGHEHVKIKDGVPEGWEKVALSELCSDRRMAVNPQDLPTETPYIGLEHIPRRSITICDWGVASDVNSGKFKFDEGDILFGKIRPYFHKVGFTICSGITSSDAIVIQAKEDIYYHYTLLLVSSGEFVALASKTVKEGSKMPRADWEYLSKCQFLLPKISMVQAFNDFIAPICTMLRMLALQNRQLITARDLLLPRLMNGQIVV